MIPFTQSSFEGDRECSLCGVVAGDCLSTPSYAPSFFMFINCLVVVVGYTCDAFSTGEWRFIHRHAQTKTK